MDWKATLEEILAERRQRLGERPSLDDWIALRAGELADDARRDLLEHAAADPEAARELFDVLHFPEPSPDEDPAPDEDGVGERWQALRARLVAAGELPAAGPPAVAAPSRRAATGRPTWLPLAATFVLGVAGALALVRLRDAGPPAAGPEASVNLAIVELLPLTGTDAGLRGAEVATVAADAGGLVLTLALPDPVPSADRGPYTLEIERGDGSTATLDGLRPGVGGVFVLAVPRALWADGLHELRLKDADGRPVARFELMVELR